jgi:hypothetical protein
VDRGHAADLDSAARSNGGELHMSKNIIKLIACLAWAGVAISSATPADALLVTTSTGPYATCSAEWQYRNNASCTGMTFLTSYQQQIKFVTTACSGGACSMAFAPSIYTENVYGTGRKTTTSYGLCDPSFLQYIYGLGTCAC